MRPVRSVAGVPRMCGAVMGGRLLVAALLVVSLAPSSWANSLSDFAVFGGTNVFIWDGPTVSGQVGSNGAVFAGASTLYGPVVGGGVFTSGGGNRIFGDMRFNGGVTLADTDKHVGQIYSSGYTAVDLPATMYPGDLPGTSGPLLNASVTLSAGSYRYDSIGGTLHLDLHPSQDPIAVYVDGDVSISDVSVSIWDGQQYLPYAQAIADPVLRALAQNVYFETGGSWFSTGEWFGLIYAPNSGASIWEGSNITGAVWAGQDVSLYSNSQVNVIPEPITAVGLVLGVSALGGVVRRRFAASLRRG